MKFTLVFPSKEADDLSYGLLFIPCPVWKRGEEEILNIHPEEPSLRKGDFSALLEKEPKLKELKDRRVVVVVHNYIGNATYKDFLTLIEDIVSSGFSPEVIFLPKTID